MNLLMTPYFVVGLATLLLAGAGTGCKGPGLEQVPGVVVHHVPSPSLLQRLTRRVVYTASPSIVVLPDGTYVITCNIFGAGSGAQESGTTYVYGSPDRGVTWNRLTELSGMKRGSLFVHRDDLYLWGYTAAPGDIVIRKSTDGGRTWTTPTDEQRGLLRQGSYGGTPFIPAVHDGRIWMAQSGKQVMSAPLEADLMRADSWALSRAAQTEAGPLGPGLTITEAQIVAAPHTGVVLLPKVQHVDPHTVLLRVGDSPEKVIRPRNEDWIPFPGGEKKFAALYDPVSERFYALTNPVLPQHANSWVRFQMIRNAGALLVSEDLRTWEMRGIFLYSPDVRYTGFQYFSCAIDGEDLVVASRTAYRVGRRRPPRQHDSNLITFHRIPDFRGWRDASAGHAGLQFKEHQLGGY